MATKIQIKRGTKTNLPTLSPGEFGLTTDTEELYIGGNNGNIRMGKNGESSTPNATATHSGSVVAITAPAGVNLISFYAPSDFSGDDTYTVNGSAVTLTDLNGNAVYDGWKEGAPVQLILKGTQAFFKSGGGVNDTLPPLNPNMTGELADGVFTVTADKLPVAQADALAGAEWYYADHVPARPGDGTKVEFTREQLITGAPEGKAANEYNAGDIVTIKENGVSQEFYIAKHGYPEDGNGLTLLVRRFLYTADVWNVSGTNNYDGSSIDNFLSNTYYPLLEPEAQKAIVDVNIPYTPGNGNNAVTNILKKVFALSGTELGRTLSSANTEGTRLPSWLDLYVAQTQGGINAIQWTRTPVTTNTTDAAILNTGGAGAAAPVTNEGGYRPAYAIKSTTLFDSNNNSLVGEQSDQITVNIPWTESGYCYCRQFPYNAKHQYQTQLVGAVATNDPDYDTVEPGLPEFEYTGTYQLLDDGDGNWRIKFTTSGTLTMAKTTTVDVFLVGGGGGGVSGGGGGGYTATHTSAVLEGGTPYTVTIGGGGTGGSGGMAGNGSPGGATSIGTYSITGGASANQDDGGNGGSGGGGSGSESDNWRNGGDGGSDGANGSTASHPGGTGQGTTTREFGEPTGELYSGGGGGESGDSRRGGNGGAGGPNETIALGGSSSRGKDGQTPGDGIGGTGGIGRLGVGSHERDYYGGGGGAGYGGGGGGSYAGGSSAYRGGNGFQGIAIIRNHREAAS